MSASEHIQSWAGTLKASIYLLGVLGVLLWPAMAGLWFLYGQTYVLPELREGLGVNDLQRQIASVEQRLAAALGEDEVITVNGGLSYVRRPAYIGETMTLVLHLRRTRYGEECTYTGGQSVFFDETGFSNPGGPVPPQRQLTTAPDVIRVRLVPPRGLKSGWAAVMLELSYDCGRELPEIARTPPVSFTLLPYRGE